MRHSRQSVLLPHRSATGSRRDLIVDRRWFRRQVDIELARMHPADAASLLRPWHDGRRDLTDEEWSIFLGMLARIANRAQEDPEAQPRH